MFTSLTTFTAILRGMQTTDPESPLYLRGTAVLRTLYLYSLPIICFDLNKSRHSARGDVCAVFAEPRISGAYSQGAVPKHTGDLY